MGDDDLKFKHPFSCIVSGPIKSGKTSLCIRFVQNFDALCTEREIGGGITWCYSEKTTVPQRQPFPSNTTCHEGVPQNFGGGGKPRLVILDDLLNNVYSKQVCKFVYETQSSQKYQRDFDYAKFVSSAALL